MAKKFAQFKITSASADNIFGKINSVYSIQLQSEPGTIFQLNSGSNIKVGETGLYKIELAKPLIKTLTITTLPSGSALIDIIYEGSDT